MLRDSSESHVFSEALVSRSTGKWSLIQARAIRDEKGNFLGTVNAVIDLATFARYFASIDTGPGGVVLLRRSDNFKLIQRQPRLKETDFNQPLPPDNDIRRRLEAGEYSGSLTYVASTDGVQRVGSFKRLDNYPFYVQVALSADHYLYRWEKESTRAIVLVITLLVSIAILLWRLLQSRHQTAEISARLEKISKNIPGVIYQFQRWPDGRSAFPYASEGIRQIYGMTPAQVQKDASPVYAVLHPDDLSRVAQRIEISATHLERWHDQYRAILPHGQIRWLEGEATPEHLPDGSVLWHGYIHDITEQKKLEHARDQAAAKIHAVLDALEGLVYVSDLDTHQILYANKTLQNITGEIVGQVCWQVLQTGMRKPCDFCTNPRLLAKDGTPNEPIVWESFNPQTNRWFQRRDKAIVWPDGRLVRLEVAIDITERKLAQDTLDYERQRLRILIDTIPDLIWYKDVEGRYLGCNPRFEQFFGVSEADIIGKTDYDFVDPKLADAFVTMIVWHCGKPRLDQ
ncbi:PAS domain S-box protein [Thioflexithrix psekupsensis]|uniref:histidine kinase n=1 Tax=Thioflexithrix psekupsensis TaxID=1570016 RepID=A0A251XBW1_9GAMM|nr:PAS domain S-box protein [Thioflexithrix psekupsensis]OUD15932.1 hypothetical protein TPSD3_01315 [Thioflexithrix psekupsensis]